MPAPREVVHDTQSSALEIEWEGGVRSRYDAAYLRGWCPCAGCQGHSATVTWHDPPADVRLAGVWELGAYALAVRFSDGHDTGIFTWEWLEKIAHEAAPVGPKRGWFCNGRFG